MIGSLMLDGGWYELSHSGMAKTRPARRIAGNREWERIEISDLRNAVDG